MEAPALSVSQITTFASSFADDVHAYAAAGLDGIGIWERKLAGGDDAAAADLLAASGLRSASAIPEVPSILPLPRFGGPTDPAERLDSLCRSLERLAPFRPAGVVCLTGSGLGREPDEARAVVVDGLATLAREAGRLGLRVGLEPYHREDSEEWSIVSSIGEAVALVHDAGDPPELGLQFDVWHLWSTPTLLEDIAREVGRFVGVHVSDRRVPTRGWVDRALPGEGCADVPRILRALHEAGWRGLYDVEIFSDDGTFGAAYPDSLWALPAPEALRRVRAAFEAAWAAAEAPVPVPRP